MNDDNIYELKDEIVERNAQPQASTVRPSAVDVLARICERQGYSLPQQLRRDPKLVTMVEQDAVSGDFVPSHRNPDINLINKINRDQAFSSPIPNRSGFPADGRLANDQGDQAGSTDQFGSIAQKSKGVYAWEWDWRGEHEAGPNPAPFNSSTGFQVRELCIQVFHNPPSQKKNAERKWRFKLQLNQDAADYEKWLHEYSGDLIPPAKFVDHTTDAINRNIAAGKVGPLEKDRITAFGNLIADLIETKEWQAFALLQPITGGRPARPPKINMLAAVRFHGRPSFIKPNVNFTGEAMVVVGDQMWRFNLERGRAVGPVFKWQNHWFDRTKAGGGGISVSDEEWE